jgi:lactate dehydrogenase-like 2-hydroxyacid dehydrogenase
MKIVIYNPKSDFSAKQQHVLSKFGKVNYLKDRKPLPLEKIISMAKDADIVAADPDPFGGFEKAQPILTQLMDSLPNLKGICLSTTSFGWIDLEYCRKRKLPVCNVPGYSRESVAEHTLTMLLGVAKRIFITDRATQKGKYQLGMGFELKGKTLGIIGLGNIGSRVAELGQGIGMDVIAYNRTPKKQKGVKMVTLKYLLKNSDSITFHTTHEPNNANLIDEAEIKLMKPGVIIVNTVDRELVNEKAMAKALKSGHVYGYAYEGEDLINTPLAGLENAIGLKGFGWYTKEALTNLYDIWVDNIASLAQGHPQNRVV